MARMTAAVAALVLTSAIGVPAHADPADTAILTSSTIPTSTEIPTGSVDPVTTTDPPTPAASADPITPTTAAVPTTTTTPTSSADPTTTTGPTTLTGTTTIITTTVTTAPTGPTTTTGSTTSTGLTTPTGPSRPEGDPGKAQSFWLHLDSSPISDSEITQHAKKLAYVVLNAWEGNLSAKFKKANPAIKVFVYKDLSSTRSYACRNGADDKQIPTGVGYCEAASHPEWFLTDTRGKRFEYSGYTGHWQMDVGNAEYRRRWGDNVIASVKAGGFDGVLMDNALFGCDTYHDGRCPKAYQTDQAFQVAYQGMFAALRPRFAAAGILTVANLANARLYPGTWNAYTEYLDGGFDEWWVAFSGTNLLPAGADGWTSQAEQIASNEARGKITWVQPHLSPGDHRAFRYALASYFLVKGGKSAIAETVGTDNYGDLAPQRPEYGWDLGKPTGPYKSVGKNLLRRDFACGAVVVNTNKTGAGQLKVDLGRTYSDEQGSSVLSISLGGTTGSVLRKPCTAASSQ
ncbi:putative glycoside hydrolase family 15 protein [Umezawaea endophytica]|uniref:Glycoside hydrolase family 15 protein n=1 Tax=Umezawaea endophytica TaxID=1654476 RepID=A0A9X2VKZ1_9PSEU|nr:putative glycoside hydrolase family 15 protein [Umezawaea endophytica]MCS7478540.1 putative glycoside hydrolase family 15 protein [Umezawaea endophytica]